MSEGVTIAASATKLAIVDALVETSHSLVCILAPDGRILHFNRQCQEATGYTAEEAVGADACDLVIPPEERDNFHVFLERSWETRRPTPMVGQWVAKDHSRFLVAWSNRPITAEDGTPVCIVTAGLRLGERERASAEVRSLHQMLESRLVELTRLAAEQSALRRVATLVATSHQPDEIFQAVTGEMARVIGGRTSAILRYNDDETATVVGRFSLDEIPAFPLGSSISLAADSAVARVYRSAEPHRLENYDDLEGEVADAIREHGLTASAAAPILVDGRPWGAVIVVTGEQSPFADGIEQRLHEFAELLSVAIVGADAREQLLESRARVLRASDAERARLQRNLHDGAQQQLVALSLALRWALQRLEVGGQGVAELLTKAAEDAAVAIEELRRLAHGLHPAVLAEFGLERALQGLGARAPMPVEVSVEAGDVTEDVAAAIYYLVAESLTNSAKHAEATSASVRVSQADGLLTCAVADDGCGGASAAGTGIRGLRDRVEAARGTFWFESPEGGGTRLAATFRIG